MTQTLMQVEKLEEKIIAFLKEIYDPEIPVNIYDLGLIYNIDLEEIENGYAVDIDMTLTSAACSMSEMIVESVRSIKYLDENIVRVNVNLVFEPPWSMQNVSDEGKLLMNML